MPPEILFIIIVWVVCAIVRGQVASKKGYAYNSYALLGLLTGIIGLIIVFVMPDKTQGKEASDAEALLGEEALAHGQVARLLHHALDRDEGGVTGKHELVRGP